jgi:hypothetical protein
MPLKDCVDQYVQIRRVALGVPRHDAQDVRTLFQAALKPPNDRVSHPLVRLVALEYDSGIIQRPDDFRGIVNAAVIYHHGEVDEIGQSRYRPGDQLLFVVGRNGDGDLVVSVHGLGSTLTDEKDFGG